MEVTTNRILLYQVGDRVTYTNHMNKLVEGTIVETRPNNKYGQTYVVDWKTDRLYYYRTHDIEDNRVMTVHPKIQLPEELFTL